MKKLVHSYYRGQDEITEADKLTQALPGIVLLASTLILVAVFLWQVTLSFAFAGATTLVIRKVRERRQDRLVNGLRVTYMSERMKVI